MTGYCSDNNNNKIVLLCYLSIIFVTAYYYCWLLPQFLFFLSVGDPGLPRFAKLRAFGIVYEPFFFFFDNENYYQCVFYTCIYWSSHLKLLSKYSVFMLWPSSECVLRSGCTAHKNTVANWKIEWYHLIVKAVVRNIFFGVTHQ